MDPHYLSKTDFLNFRRCPTYAWIAFPGEAVNQLAVGFATGSTGNRLCGSRGSGIFGAVTISSSSAN
jgi:hypothetical protein